MVSVPVFYSTGDLLDGRYRIQDIKWGAMGIVYLCEDIQKKRPIAVKSFQDNFLKSEESRNRFLQEAMFWIELGKHPNIVQAYGLRLIDGKPHLLLERINSDVPRGVTLKDLLHTEVLNLRDALQIAIYICDGIIHARNKYEDFVHCDLKPENILLGRDRVAKITDFGLMSQWKQIQRKDIPDASKLSPELLALNMEGTPAYSSPEQCRLQPVDTRSDIYSFGCILYRMMAKRVPYAKEESAEFIRAHLFEQPVPPINHNPKMNDELSDIILQCLMKDPDNRFQSFQDVRAELFNMFRLLYAEKPKSNPMEIRMSFDELAERAWSYALVNRLREAEAIFNQLEVEYPDHKEIYLHRARFYLACKKYDEAMLKLVDALHTMPEYPEIYEMMGKVLLTKGELNEAMMNFRTAIRLNPSRIQPYIELSQIFASQKDEKEEVKILQQGNEACDYPFQLVIPLADLHEQKKNYRTLRDFLRKAEVYNTDDNVIKLRLGKAYAQLKDKRSALKYVKDILELEPNSFEEWRLIGDIYALSEDPIRADDAWEQALAYDDGNGEFYLTMAKNCIDLRKFEDAWQRLLEAEEFGLNVDDLKKKVQARRLKF